MALRVPGPSRVELGSPIPQLLEMAHDNQDARSPLVTGLHILSVKHKIETRIWVCVAGPAKDEDTGLSRFLVGDFIDWKNKKRPT